MLTALKFVKGAISKKSSTPALTHFCIEKGHVRSFNGVLALSSPIPLDIDCIPKAEPFIRAIQSCKETVKLGITPNGRLSVKSGKFQAYIETLQEETPHVVPEGEEFIIDGQVLLEGFKIINPFIGNDSTQPWSNGVLLSNGSLFATNNVSFIEYWTSFKFPIDCNVPREAIREIIRIKKPPSRIQMNERSITFHYEDDRWVQSRLLATDWPDFNKLLEIESNQTPLDERIFEALATIKPFTDNLSRIYFRPGIVKTSLIDTMGASYELEDLNYEGVFQLPSLNLLKGVATTIDLSAYPKPCLFYGDRVRGVLIGMMP